MHDCLLEIEMRGFKLAELGRAIIAPQTRRYASGIDPCSILYVASRLAVALARLLAFVGTGAGRCGNAKGER